MKTGRLSLGRTAVNVMQRKTIALIVHPYLPDTTASVVLFTTVATLLGILASCRV